MKKFGSATVVHACYPNTLGGRGRWMTRSGVQNQPGQDGETPSVLKIQKISQAWWQVPVVPGTGEAEPGEWREPGRWNCATALQPGRKSETPSQKTKNKQKVPEKHSTTDRRRHI